MSQRSNKTLKALFFCDPANFGPAQAEILRSEGFRAIPFTLKEANTDGDTRFAEEVRYVRGGTEICVTSTDWAAASIALNGRMNVVVMGWGESHPSCKQLQQDVQNGTGGKVTVLKPMEPIMKTILTMVGPSTNTLRA